MVTPELNLPKRPAIAGDGHEWKENNYSHLFWVIPRDDSEEKWNCEMFHIEVTQAHALQPVGGRAVARTFTVSVPALRNTRPIAKDEEIVLMCPKPKQVTKPKPRGATLLTAAQREGKKRKTTERGAAPPSR